MRIALVHSYYADRTPSGENVVVDQQRQALSDLGNEVSLVAVRTDDLQNRPAYSARAAIGVATGGGMDPSDELRDLHPDVVHVHNLFPNFGTHWLRSWDTPVVTTVHNFRPACANGLLLRDGHACTLCPDRGTWNGVRYACYRESHIATLPLAVRNRRGPAHDPLLARAEAVVCPGEHVRDVYASWGLPSEKLHVVPHFTPRAPIAPIDHGAWVVASRLSPEKGVLELLRAWPHHEPLVVYGDGPLRDEVAALCSGSIRYAGRVSPDEVAAALAGAIGSVIPSRWLEIGPLTYGESLARATPVIALRGNGAAIDIERSGAGIVIDDMGQLPEALHRMRAERDGFAQAANHRFELRYTVAAWQKTMTALYESLV